MTLPVRPILSVLLLAGGFICLAVGLVSFKQLQVSAPESLPQNMVAVTPTLPAESVTPTVTLPPINIRIVAGATGQAQIILASSSPITVTGLSLRLRADRQLPGPAAPFRLSPDLVKAGWVSPVNALTLENQQSFFDLAVTILQPGGAVLSPGQILATLPVSASELKVDPVLSRLIDDQNTAYQLVQIKP